MSSHLIVHDPGKVYRLPECKEAPAAIFEAMFERNGWGGSWRNGVYDFVHFHSMIHEALGVACGRARVRFGGQLGRELDLTAGDVAVLPAGTGHQRLFQTPDLVVIGAYPPSGSYDECRATEADHDRAVKTIAKVGIPRKDPVFGAHGPLRKLWR